MSLALLLGDQLRAFTDAGYEVLAASAPGPYLADIEATGAEFVPVEHFTRSMAPHRDLAAFVELIRLFRRLRPTIVHTHNPKPGVLGRLAARAARVPVVVNTVHGLYALPEDRLAKRCTVYGLERLAASCSDLELLQNPEDLPTLRGIGIPARRLRVLGNGIDLTRFDPDRLDQDEVRRVRHELGAEDGEVLVGTVGRLVWEKGLQELFDVARSLRASLPAARFVVVGPLDPAKADGLGPDDLEAIERETGIRFAGERRDMDLVLAAFDLFVLASHREGFPRAAMEAAATGIPIVATDIRGCRQVVATGENGLLVPPRNAAALGEAIAMLVGDGARREEMGRAGRARAHQEFDQQMVIERTLAAYADLGVEGASRS